MALNVTSRLEDNFGILHLAGSLTLGPSLSALREAARKVLGMGDLYGLILWVAEVTIVYTFASKRKCPIRLVGVSPSLHKMLEMTRLDELLQAADDLASAKQQLKQP
jgi:hypothetical protein